MKKSSLFFVFKQKFLVWRQIVAQATELVAENKKNLQKALEALLDDAHYTTNDAKIHTLLQYLNNAIFITKAHDKWVYFNF